MGAIPSPFACHKCLLFLTFPKNVKVQKTRPGSGVCVCVCVEGEEGNPIETKATEFLFPQQKMKKPLFNFRHVAAA